MVDLCFNYIKIESISFIKDKDIVSEYDSFFIELIQGNKPVENFFIKGYFGEFDNLFGIDYLGVEVLNTGSFGGMVFIFDKVHG